MTLSGVRDVSSMSPWCELHCHSAFSLRDGTCLPEALVERAAALGYPALALTDHLSLAGIVVHARACEQAGLRPIAGLEVRLDDESHLTLLARDAAGYRSLAVIASLAHLTVPHSHREQPAIALAALAAHTSGVECLSGCRRGRVASALLCGDAEGALHELRRLRDFFGADHVWLEVQRAGLPDDAKLLYGLAELARRAQAPLVATGNAHYADARDRDLHDVLSAIRHRVPLTAARRFLRPGASWHLRSADEMARRFADLPDAIAGAVTLARRCGFALDHIDAALPIFPLPPDETAQGYLERLVRAGAAERYGASAETDAVQRRLAHELAVIAALHLSDYLLMVWDIVREARERSILVQGRGSAVGSLCCYCLGITAVEPLSQRLSFERFLAPGRTDPPDIDLDLPADRSGTSPGREAIIQYVLGRYAGHAALVSTVVTYRPKSAIRDVGLALGLAPAQIDALAADPEVTLGLDPRHANIGDHNEEEAEADCLDDSAARGRHAEAAGAGDAEADGRCHGEARVGTLGLPSGRVLQQLRRFCARLQGVPRHLSQHPGGVVVTARPLTEVVPVQRSAMEGRLIVQFDKEAAELAGFVKIDLLGLGMLAVIDQCFDLIACQTGRRPALHGWRVDDARVYDMICRSDTIGTFQIESRAQIAFCLPLLQPRTYADLTVAVAIVRPGPIQAGATHPYLRRRRGREPVVYPGGAAGRRLLEPILRDTLGVCVFQDQIIELCRAAGLDAGEAAEVRRAMSSARSAARMAALRDRLDAALAAQGLDHEGRAAVLGMIQAFAGYGFIRGHAAAFAYLSYVSAALKRAYPALFAAALLNMQPMGFYAPEVVMQDAERHGVRFRPPDVRYSQADCTIAEDGSVRLGLKLIDGLGPDACARLEAATADGHAPDDIEELCRRARLDEREALALARAGALAAYWPARRDAMWHAPLVARAVRERWLPGVRAAADAPVRLPRATAVEEFALERAALGLAPGGHILAHLRPLLEGRRLHRAAELARLANGMAAEVVGHTIVLQSPPTAKGVWFLTLTEEGGFINVVVPPAVYARDRATIRGQALVWLRGVVERRSGTVALQALWVRPLVSLLPLCAPDVPAP